MLADHDATDFIGITSVPIFKEPSPSRPSWSAMQAGAYKHDTFVYSRAGMRALYWDASAENLAAWQSDIRAAVETLGR